MTDTEIKKAVEHIERWEKEGVFQNNFAFKTLLSLAQAYLSVKCPDESDVNDRDCYIYNQGIKNYRLWLTKRLEGLPLVIEKNCCCGDCSECNYRNCEEERTNKLANAIRRMFE